MTFAFERLLVYQKSVDFADAVCTATEQFQRGYGFLVDQLNRAALSISSDIAEGSGRFTKADRKNFFGIAHGSETGIHFNQPMEMAVEKETTWVTNLMATPLQLSFSSGCSCDFV